MNAEEPWLIDIRGTIPIPKTAAKQTARSAPDKRAPMTRPKTVQLGRIPLQKKGNIQKRIKSVRHQRGVEASREKTAIYSISRLKGRPCHNLQRVSD